MESGPSDAGTAYTIENFACRSSADSGLPNQLAKQAVLLRVDAFWPLTFHNPGFAKNRLCFLAVMKVIPQVVEYCFSTLQEKRIAELIYF